VAAPQIVQVVGGAGSSFATAAGTAVGDYLVAFQATGLTGTGPPAQPSGTYTSGWTVLADLTSTANGKVKAWYRRITDAAGAKTVTVSGGNSTYGDFLTVAVIRDANDTTFIDGTVSTVYVASNGALTIPAGITTTITDAHLLAFWFTNHVSGAAGTATVPAGMTQQLNNQTTMSGVALASEVRTAAGAVGARVLTYNTGLSGSYPSGALMFAVKPAALPVGMTDSASGTDTFGITGSIGASDSATGSDMFAVTSRSMVADQATGAETFSLSATATATDAAAGTDTFTVTDLTQTPLTDSAAGGERFDISAIQNPVADVAAGSETFGLQRQSTVADDAAGSETFTFQRLSTWTDAATGSEVFSIVEVANTQVLPLQPERTYELVVMARIHQAGGAPTYSEVDPITWSSLTYRDTISAAQELTATCKISTLTESVLQHLRYPDQFPLELWVRRSGQIIFAGPFEAEQIDDQKVELRGKGLLTYLSWMALDVDKQFLATDQASVVKGLVDAYQVGNFAHLGIDTTRVTATGRLIDYTYLRDELNNVAKAADDIGKADGGFDLDVDPSTRQLICWSPIKGVDRSTGEDAIVLDSRNVTSGNILRSVGADDLATDVYATGSKAGGDAPLFVAVGNDQLRARYGKKVITRTFSNVADLDQLTALATATLNARGNALVVPGTKVRVTPDADIADYTAGDIVSYDMGGELGTSGAFRIRSRTVTVDESGHESVDLEPA
jgi:hypothetical protein